MPKWLKIVGAVLVALGKVAVPSCCFGRKYDFVSYRVCECVCVRHTVLIVSDCERTPTLVDLQKTCRRFLLLLHTLFK